MDKSAAGGEAEGRANRELTAGLDLQCAAAMSQHSSGARTSMFMDLVLGDAYVSAL